MAFWISAAFILKIFKSGPKLQARESGLPGTAHASIEVFVEQLGGPWDVPHEIDVDTELTAEVDRENGYTYGEGFPFYEEQ